MGEGGGGRRLASMWGYFKTQFDLLHTGSLQNYETQFPIAIWASYARAFLQKL